MSDDYVNKVASSLSLDSANKIAAAALQAGRDAKMLPLTVVVLDSGGHMVAFQRQDGSGILRHDIAFGKAWGALGMGISSRTIRDRMADRPAFQGALAAASQGRFIPVPGGVLICDGPETVVGAVGISGDTSQKDEYSAIEGIKAAGFTTHPEEAEEGWQSSGL